MDGTFTVFLVDDDAGVLKALSRLLRQGLSRPAVRVGGGVPRGPRGGCRRLRRLRCRDAGSRRLGIAANLHGKRQSATGHFPHRQGRYSKKRARPESRRDRLLAKPVSDRTLLDAIAREVAEGVDAKTRQIGAELTAIDYAKIVTLTPREREVLTHVVGGSLNKQIAARLGTVEKTIKVHRGRMMEKLGVRTVADLVRLAEKAGVAAHGK